MFVGSDAIALAPFTDSIAYLEDGDWAVLTRKAIAIRDRNGNAVERRGDPVARHRAPRSTRATTAISWRRRSTSSPR